MHQNTNHLHYHFSYNVLWCDPFCRQYSAKSWTPARLRCFANSQNTIISLCNDSFDIQRLVQEEVLVLGDLFHVVDNTRESLGCDSVRARVAYRTRQMCRPFHQIPIERKGASSFFLLFTIQGWV
jgi:hypothetical protein